jgi:hypothetical protein
MRFAKSAALAALIGMTACSGFSASKLNPLNWFKGSTPEQMEFIQRPVDARALVAQVTELKVEAFPGGAIVRATGVPTSQGWWDAELVKVVSEEDGVILFEFRIYPPPVQRPAGTPFSREVTVAASLSNIALQDVSKIVVQGEANALSSRR